MKKIISHSRWSFLLGFLILMTAACNKNDVTVTKDAKAGGLILPTPAFFYKLGKTTSVDIIVKVPTGPQISEIHIYNKYVKNDTTQSNEVLMKTVTGPGSADSLHFTYTDLKKDLILEGGPMPASDTSLAIGSYFLFRYEVKMADGRVLSELAKTNIGISNFFAGAYHDSGTFTHPVNGPRLINEDKNLVAINAFECTTTVGDLSSYGYLMKINIDPVTKNAVVYAVAESGSPALIMSTDKQSKYDPATGIITLNYFYVGATGNRVIQEVYTPK
ncbi:MAG: hypothetical protein WCL00_00265 [Bacteroidota bacterium]